jgi:hypothetical protein
LRWRRPAAAAAAANNKSVPLVREGAPHKKNSQCLDDNKKSGFGQQRGLESKTDWPTGKITLNIKLASDC